MSIRFVRSGLLAGCSVCLKVVMQTMNVPCSMCGTNVNCKPSRLKRHANIFCSYHCHTEFMKRGKEVKCAFCGKSFYKSPSKMTQDNLCSAVCRNDWLGKRNLEIMNVAGHSKGHKAPHLTKLNQNRNPLCGIMGEIRKETSVNYRGLVEKEIGRKLQSNEVVHHISGDRTDNRLENLAVMTKAEHGRLHMSIAIERCKQLTKGGDALCQKR